MNYLEYHEIYYKFVQAKIKLQKIQNEIENIILKMLSSTSEIKDNVSNLKTQSDKMLSLTSKKIDLEAEEKIQQELLNRRRIKKEEAEIELRKSNNEKDKIYYMYFINHDRVKDIAIKIGYTREYTYDLLDKIKKDKYEIEQKMQKK